MIRTRRPPSDFRQYFTVSEPVRCCCICRPNVHLPSFLPSATDCLSVSRSGPQNISLKETSKITAQIYLSYTLFSAQFSHNNVTVPLVPFHITPLVISPMISLLSLIVKAFFPPLNAQTAYSVIIGVLCWG
jgi:hypothetical protein